MTLGKSFKIAESVLFYVNEDNFPALFCYLIIL